MLVILERRIPSWPRMFIGLYWVTFKSRGRRWTPFSRRVVRAANKTRERDVEEAADETESVGPREAVQASGVLVLEGSAIYDSSKYDEKSWKKGEQYSHMLIGD